MRRMIPHSTSSSVLPITLLLGIWRDVLLYLLSASRMDLFLPNLKWDSPPYTSSCERFAQTICLLGSSSLSSWNKKHVDSHIRSFFFFIVGHWYWSIPKTPFRKSHSHASHLHKYVWVWFSHLKHKLHRIILCQSHTSLVLFIRHWSCLHVFYLIKKLCKCDLLFVSMVDEALSSTKICVNYTNLCKFTQIFTPSGRKNVHMCKCDLRKGVLGMLH
jgi:hypothetical protein